MGSASGVMTKEEQNKNLHLETKRFFYSNLDENQKTKQKGLHLKSRPNSVVD